MRNKLTILLAAAALMSGAAFAGESNFKPANMSGDAPAAETARARAEAAKSNEPGFWSREWKRSGLSRMGNIFKPSEWRKKQDSSAS